MYLPWLLGDKKIIMWWIVNATVVLDYKYVCNYKEISEFDKTPLYWTGQDSPGGQYTCLILWYDSPDSLEIIKITNYMFRTLFLTGYTDYLLLK